MPVQSLAAIAYQAPRNVRGRYEGNRCIMNEDNIKPRIESGNPEVESLYGLSERRVHNPIRDDWQPTRPVWRQLTDALGVDRQSRFSVAAASIIQGFDPQGHHLDKIRQWPWYGV